MNQTRPGVICTYLLEVVPFWISKHILQIGKSPWTWNSYFLLTLSQLEHYKQTLRFLSLSSGAFWHRLHMPEAPWSSDWYLSWVLPQIRLLHEKRLGKALKAFCWALKLIETGFYISLSYFINYNNIPVRCPLSQITNFDYSIYAF